ncbi:MAG: 3-phosphoshikimate 1-carboxyvinyltransferase, partial [Candidatus Omnitrophica bacterium]|nr:3-phosphoshikimate 1-carboxyvinyltransferase [Candidatus Omnitrophota bacterium]
RRTLIQVLLRMGARIRVINEKGTVEPMADLKVQGTDLSAAMIGAEEIPEIIDEIPILCVACSFARGTSRIHGVGELRVKETDRIASMVDNLSRMGVNIKAEGETIIIEGRTRRFGHADLVSMGDHRTAMAMSVAGSVADGPSTVRDIDCVKTSFPEFYDLLKHCGR